MKVELIGHDEKYALEQSLLTLFPGEKPVYGTVDKTADTRWARVTLTEEDERVQVTTELGVDGKSAAHSYAYPLSGTEYEKEGQRRHAVGIRFFGAAGLDTHSEISRLMRFSHVLEITDGTNEIQKLIIGKGIARRCR